METAFEKRQKEPGFVAHVHNSSSMEEAGGESVNFRRIRAETCEELEGREGRVEMYKCNSQNN